MLRRHLSRLVLPCRLRGRRVMGSGPADRAVRSRGPARRARPSSRNSRMRCRRGPKARVASASRTTSTARSASTPPRRSGGPRTAPSRSICLYPGFIFEVPVNINLVVGGTARRVLFANERFAYGADVPLVAATGEYTGYSGFRVRAPINAADYPDEFLVFQGASYFRARRERAAVRLLGARSRRSHGAARRRGVSRISRTSGSSARPSKPSRSSFTRCCRARRSSARIRSRRGPATRPSSTSSRRCSRASSSRRSASRR